MDMLLHWFLSLCLEHTIPYVWGFLFWYVFEFALIAAFMVITVIILVLAERKILALFTVRKGPNRVGLFGCLQTIADAFKLLFKEDIIPDKADKLLFWIAPLFVFTPIMFVWTLIPYCSTFIPLKSEVSLLIFLAAMLVPTFGILLAGYASENKYSIIGALRACIQTVSYEIPLLISVMSAVVLSGSMSLNEIVLTQSSCGIFSWFFIPGILGFLVFFVSALAEMNRTPFDFPEAESELVSGYNTEYSGMKFAMFFLGEYAATFIISAFAVTLFFGGYSSPFGVYVAHIFSIGGSLAQVMISLEQLFWLISKTAVMIFVIMWIRATLPRIRNDVLALTGWKYLLPISIINLVVVCAVKHISGGCGV